MTRAAHVSGFATAVFAATIFAAAGPAAAQSFNCGAATRSAEIAICKSDRLSRLDERMSRLYDSLQASTNDHDSDRLRAYQMRFLAARDACGRDISCIKGAYLDQIEVLSARIRVAETDGD
jgi:uncharacterized protein